MTRAEWDGRPENPERDGWHWVGPRYSSDPASLAWWDGKHWWDNGKRWTRHMFPLAHTYLGPCLPPDETKALLARAEKAEAERDAAREEATRLREVCLLVAEDAVSLRCGYIEIRKETLVEMTAALARGGEGG